MKYLFTIMCLVSLLMCNLACSKNLIESDDNNDLPDDNSFDESSDTTLIKVAQSNRLWTGIAISNDNRIFVNFPNWSRNHSISVGVLNPVDEVIPYPNISWNEKDSSISDSTTFVCVQSVYVDKNNYLWILDSGSPQLSGVITGGAKLVQIDLTTDQILRVYYFNSEIVPFAAYLNDVRIDIENNFAFITDSGLGAIIVLDLDSGISRRVLHSHNSTKSELVTLVVEEIEWLEPSGEPRQIHSDGIALDLTNEYIYYQALTANTLYRIKIEYLINFDLSENDLSGLVEFVGTYGAADGIAFDNEGNLYITSIESNSIRRLNPSGILENIITDSRIKWPDSIAITQLGDIYFTTSHLHLGQSSNIPYYIFKINYSQ